MKLIDSSSYDVSSFTGVDHDTRVRLFLPFGRTYLERHTKAPPVLMFGFSDGEVMSFLPEPTDLNLDNVRDSLVEYAERLADAEWVVGAAFLTAAGEGVESQDFGVVFSSDGGKHTDGEIAVAIHLKEISLEDGKALTNSATENVVSLVDMVTFHVQGSNPTLH